MALGNESDHRCAGCIHNAFSYKPECKECRRRGNADFMLPGESVYRIVMIDKYTLEDTSVVSFGSTKILKRSSIM